MQDNSQNNWKTLLEDPENFAGETVPHKNEVWEKLYQRLYKKPRQKLVAWYLVAACLVIAVSVTVVVFVNGKKQQQAFSVAPATVQNQLPLPTEYVSGKEPKNSEQVLPAKQKTQTIVPAKKNNIAVTIPAVAHDLITDSIVKKLPNLVIRSNIINDSSAVSVTVVSPAKKKLRVVHVNEIGRPLEEPTVNNKFTEKHGLGWRIINAEIYNPVYGSSTNNGLILTKPRTSSN